MACRQALGVPALPQGPPCAERSADFPPSHESTTSKSSQSAARSESWHQHVGSQLCGRLGIASSAALRESVSCLCCCGRAARLIAASSRCCLASRLCGQIERPCWGGVLEVHSLLHLPNQRRCSNSSVITTSHNGRVSRQAVDQPSQRIWPPSDRPTAAIDLRGATCSNNNYYGPSLIFAWSSLWTNIIDHPTLRQAAG